MDGDRKEVSSGEGYCEVFFPPKEVVKARDGQMPPDAAD